MEIVLTRHILESIDNNDYSFLSSQKFSEDQLKNIAIGIKKRDYKTIMYNLIMNYIEVYNNNNYDWNMGSILKHLDFEVIISILENLDVNKKPFLYDSIGFTWLLGEANSKNKIVIDFLENVINYSRNSTAWWNAAYSLKEIDNRNAVNILKKKVLEGDLKDVNYYLDNLKDKKSVIAILLHSDIMVVKNIIYPKLIEKLPKASHEEKINIIWLLGRLKLFNNKAFSLVKDLLETTDDYDLIYQIFKAMEENPDKEFYLEFKKYLKSNKQLLVKLSIRALSKIGNVNDIDLLKKMINDETDEVIINELTKTIFILEDANSKKIIDLKYKYNFNENGMIYDKSNNWYSNPDIYDSFARVEDSNQIAFEIIKEKLRNENHKIVNPVDLATGTGKILKLIYENINYEGVLYGIDNSRAMLDYLTKYLDNYKTFVKQVQLIETNILDFELEEKSSLIISSFGFPSKISNRKQSFQELQAVYNNLTDDGVFVTYGWDEYYNDELTEMWYKYVPDEVKAKTFEHWSNKKQKLITSARNCNLRWYKRRVGTQLKFDTLEESVKTMGILFGKDCVEDIINRNKKTWWLSLGITYNTKQEIGKILEEYNNERNRSFSQV